VQPTFVRSLLVALFSAARDVRALRVFAEDEHAAVQAATFSALDALGELTPEERRSGAHADDPWIRAVFTEPPDISADAADPNERARAAERLGEARSDEATRTLLRLARDRDFGVRSAAIEALGVLRDETARLLETGALDTDERIAAYTFLGGG